MPSGSPRAYTDGSLLQGPFPQRFVVLLCLRLVPLASGHHLPTPQCPASHFLPGVPLFAQAFLPHLERSVGPRDGFCLGPEDGRGWGRVRTHSQELPQAGEGGSGLITGGALLPAWELGEASLGPAVGLGTERLPLGPGAGEAMR